MYVRESWNASVPAAGFGCLGSNGMIALQPFPPPPEPGELTEQEQEKLFRAGLIVVIVLGAGALLIDANLKRRR